MTDQYLVSFDTDRIKEYVFVTDKLREVRGASRLLTELNTARAIDAIQSICPECERVFFAGGSGAVLAPSQAKAEEIIAEVEALYRRETITGSITGACVPLTPATKTHGFGKRMEAVALKLRQSKDEKACRTLMTIEPYTQPCAACERYPATRVSSIDQQPVCESCYAKRKAFDDYRERHDPSAPEDLNALGKLARPPNYLGFIYADGNNMGERLKGLEGVAQYSSLATELNDLIERIVKESLALHAIRNGIRPYESLLVGGDDLMLVTAGDIALPIALAIAESFERGSPAALERAGLPNDKPLTLGVGVVLAHASFPIAAFQRLTAQLLKRAKRRCAEEMYRVSAIDFMVVTAAGSSDLNAVREEALTEQAFVFPHGDRRVRLTQRPYTLPEAQQLLEEIKTFKRENFPRSQLQFLYEGLFHSQVEAIYRWGKVAGRVRQKHRQLMDDFNNKFGDGASGLPPWRRSTARESKSEHTSALGDLVEIYQFVQL